MLAKPVIKHLDQQGYRLKLFSRTIDGKTFTPKHETIKGDVLNDADLQKAIEGCDTIHVNLSNMDEGLAMEKITTIARPGNIKLISYISGCTVSEKNRWFPMIDQKFRAEQAIIHSGIPYLIFRPTWFFESLDLMVRNGKATVIGKQPNLWRWISADDYAEMLVNGYKKEETWNSVFYIYGKAKHAMKDLLKAYCDQLRPEIKKVAVVSPGLLKTIAFLTGTRKLKEVASMFVNFEKVSEPENGELTYAMLGVPKLDFRKWLETKKNDLQ